MQNLLQLVYLTKESLEEDLQKELGRAIHDGNVDKVCLRVRFPFDCEQRVLQQLRLHFRRECWLLKRSDHPTEMEVDVYLQQARVLYHFSQFDDVLQGALNTAEIQIDLGNPLQLQGWEKLVSHYNLKRGETFDIARGREEGGTRKTFKVFIDKIKREEWQPAENDSIAKIDKFFQGSYEISSLATGGMGIVQKLKARHNPTILSIRRENLWARQKFSPYLRIVKDKGRESIYAEIPRGMEFAVKVAFEGHEEFLVREAAIITSFAEDCDVCNFIIGALQHGRVLDLKDSQEQIGYYLLLEYASRGSLESLYKGFPNEHLTPTIVCSLFHGMVQALIKLEQKGIIHRDIKPINIIVAGDGMAKLSDFGLAVTANRNLGVLSEERMRLLRIVDGKFLSLSRAREQAQALLCKAKDEIPENRYAIRQLTQKISHLQRQERARAKQLENRYRPISAEEAANQDRFEGSVYYAAPEQFQPQTVLTYKCDVYQLGAVMFTLLTGRRPAYGKTMDEIAMQILSDEKPAVTDFVAGPVVGDLGRLIRHMMRVDPSQRAEISDVRDELEGIIARHMDTLTKDPVFTKPGHIRTFEKITSWINKVKRAQTLHRDSVHLLFH